MTKKDKAISKNNNIKVPLNQEGILLNYMDELNKILNKKTTHQSMQIILYRQLYEILINHEINCFFPSMISEAPKAEEVILEEELELLSENMKNKNQDIDLSLMFPGMDDNKWGQFPKQMETILSNLPNGRHLLENYKQLCDIIFEAT